MALLVADLLLIDSWLDDRRRKKPVRKPMAESAVSPLGFLVCFIRLLSSLVMLNLERGQQGPKKAAARVSICFPRRLLIDFRDMKMDCRFNGTKEDPVEHETYDTNGTEPVRPGPSSCERCQFRTAGA